MDHKEFPLNQIVPEPISKSFKTVFLSQGRGECIKQASTKIGGLIFVKSVRGRERVFLFLKCFGVAETI